MVRKFKSLTLSRLGGEGPLPLLVFFLNNFKMVDGGRTVKWRVGVSNKKSEIVNNFLIIKLQGLEFIYLTSS